jgi:hypothetical protein
MGSYHVLHIPSSSLLPNDFRNKTLKAQLTPMIKNLFELWERVMTVVKAENFTED